MAPTPKVALFLALAGLSAFVVPPVFALVAALAILGAAAADAFMVRGSPGLRREAPEILSRGIPEGLDVEASVAVRRDDQGPPALAA